MRLFFCMFYLAILSPFNFVYSVEEGWCWKNDFKIQIDGKIDDGLSKKINQTHLDMAKNEQWIYSNIKDVKGQIPGINVALATVGVISIEQGFNYDYEPIYLCTNSIEPKKQTVFLSTQAFSFDLYTIKEHFNVYDNQEISDFLKNRFNQNCSSEYISKEIYNKYISNLHGNKKGTVQSELFDALEKIILESISGTSFDFKEERKKYEQSLKKGEKDRKKTNVNNNNSPSYLKKERLNESAGIANMNDELFGSDAKEYEQVGDHAPEIQTVNEKEIASCSDIAKSHKSAQLKEFSYSDISSTEEKSCLKVNSNNIAHEDCCEDINSPTENATLSTNEHGMSLEPVKFFCDLLLEWISGNLNVELYEKQKIQIMQSSYGILEIEKIASFVKFFLKKKHISINNLKQLTKLEEKLKTVYSILMSAKDRIQKIDNNNLENISNEYSGHTEQHMLHYINNDTTADDSFYFHIKRELESFIIAGPSKEIIGVVFHIHSRLDICENCAPSITRELELTHQAKTAFGKLLQLLGLTRVSFNILVSCRHDLRGGSNNECGYRRMVGFGSEDDHINMSINNKQFFVTAIKNFKPITK